MAAMVADGKHSLRADKDGASGVALDDDLPELISENIYQNSNGAHDAFHDSGFINNKVTANGDRHQGVNERSSLLGSSSPSFSSRGAMKDSAANSSAKRRRNQPCSDAECCINGCLSYEIDLSSYVENPLLPLLFLPVHCDEATKQFLYFCRDQYECFYSYNNIMTGLVKPLLKKCLAHTDLNGLLRTGQMFLASTAQLRYLLKSSTDPSSTQQDFAAPSGTANSQEYQSSISAPTMNSPQFQNDILKPYPWGNHRTVRVLDVGAGDGRVTTELVSCFDDVSTTVTEVSNWMCKRLRRRGFKVVETADLDTGIPLSRDFEGFDVISCFNVIDRCSTPITLLTQIRERLRDQNSRLILATPLPLNPSVEIGKQWVAPQQQISPQGKCWCCESFESASVDLSRLLIKLGFRIHSFSRVPYLSLGDTSRAFYTLDDIVFILSKQS